MTKEKEKRDCWNCGYKEELPGSCHISCMRKWDEIKPPKAEQTRWYNFPLNFDPVWQEEACKGWAEKRDSEKVITVDPLMKLFSILADAGR